MTVQGVINIIECNTGTKSEGNVAFLVVDERTRYKLYRAERSDINDHYFQAFANKRVIVDGEIEGDEYLCVSQIDVVPSIEEYSNEENMHEMP